MDFEQQKAMQEMTQQAQKDEWQDQLRIAQTREESFRKELQGLKLVPFNSSLRRLVFQSRT